MNRNEIKTLARIKTRKAIMRAKASIKAEDTPIESSDKMQKMLDELATLNDVLMKASVTSNKIDKIYRDMLANSGENIASRLNEVGMAQSIDSNESWLTKAIDKAIKYHIELTQKLEQVI